MFKKFFVICLVVTLPQLTFARGAGHGGSTYPHMSKEFAVMTIKKGDSVTYTDRKGFFEYVRNPSGIDGVEEHLEYGFQCHSAPGRKKLIVVAVDGEYRLIRYESVIAESYSDCPNGTVFYVRAGWFNEHRWQKNYDEVQAQKLADFVKETNDQKARIAKMLSN